MAVVGLLFALTGAWADGISVKPPSGTSLKHFTQIDKQVFAGSKPTKEADFEFLRSIGVKYVLQAHFLPFFTGAEKKRAAQYGIQYMSIEMNASPIPPMRRHVDRALRIMRTKQPIYIHCVLGRDRTGLLAGLYRLYFKGYSKEAARQLMKEEGFRGAFFVHGLTEYFNSHTEVPDDLKSLVH